MAEGTCSHLGVITTVKRAQHRQCDECVKTGAVGPSADVSGVRHDAVLR
jgi:hypothetical protein